MTSTTRRRGAALAASAGMLVAVAGCTATDGENGDTLSELQDRGSVSVGHNGEQPYSWETADGEFSGAVVALQREIFGELGIDTLEPVESEWDQLIPGVNAGRFDVVGAGMSVTPDRCENGVFSEPEIMYTTGLMVEEGNPYGLSDMQDVQEAYENDGITVAVMNGAIENGYTDDLGIDATLVGSPEDGMDEVTNGRADVFALTGISLTAMVENNPEAGVEATDPFIAVIDGVEQVSPGATVFAPGDEDLRDAYNEILAEIVADEDRYLELVGEYGFTAADRPDPDLTSEQFCSGELPGDGS